MVKPPRPSSASGGACCSPPPDGPLSIERAEALAPTFRALGDPVRLRLLSLIAASGGEVCVCDLTAAFAVTGPTISHHLRVLRETGLIQGERRGTWVYYWLVPGVLDWLGGWLDGAGEPDHTAGPRPEAAA
ncbi:MAG: helix-turn-helix transcriptional regulator [Dactylosporangium sp.]|nr:metalloregulator ArsR/SmtB family transcription factor [Dactylosporangium sp.]NNJ62874.1 helix-turn-helix transcriptional regulator [Dactylosporangium sp.]